MIKEIFLRFGSSSAIYHEYWEYKKMTDRINDVYKDFACAMGLEATEIRPYVNHLVLKVTQRDIENYFSQLAKPVAPDTFCLFKANSVVGKGWKKVMHELGISHITSPKYNHFSGNKLCCEIVFEYQGYIYIRSNVVPHRLPVGCTPILGSQFYRLLEEKQGLTKVSLQVA